MIEPMEEPPKLIRLHFNLGGISAPALKAAQLASDTVATGLIALDAHDFSEAPQIEGSTVQIKFRPQDGTDDDWREDCKSFLVRKGFQELAKGLKESLDEAYSVVHWSRIVAGEITPAELMKQVQAIAQKANKANVPTILDWINAELDDPLQHSEMVRNVQKVRSCLEHRNGIVGTVDVNNVTRDALELSVPTLKVMAVGEETGQEIEVIPGMKLEEASKVAPKFVDEHLVFPLGSQIKINPERFNHIALSNWVFASDLVKRIEALLQEDGIVDFE